MKSMHWVFAIAVLALGAVGNAWADHGHVRFGLFIGPGWGWYYPPPAYYYPPVVAVPAAPPVYVEQESASAVPEPQPNYWYYCPESQAYYPYVKDCQGGWQAVSPRP
jgi:hypothetical protein